MRWLLIIGLALASAGSAHGQDGSLTSLQDLSGLRWTETPTPLVIADTVRRDPDVALRRSLMAPGWGQIYNGDAYKLPFVWGGLAAFGGLAVYNEREYRRMQRVVRFAEFPDRYPENEADAAEYQALIDARRTTPLVNLRNSFRRSRDLSVVRFGLWYALTAVDAYVSAHLSDFDAAPDFRLTLAPTTDALMVNVVVRF